MASDQTIFSCDVQFQQFSLGYFKSKRCILDNIYEGLYISVIIARSKFIESAQVMFNSLPQMQNLGNRNISTEITNRYLL